MYYVELKISPALKKTHFQIHDQPLIYNTDISKNGSTLGPMMMMLMMLIMLMMVIMLVVLMVILVTPRMSRLWWRRKGSQGSSSITASSGRRKDSQHRWRFLSPSSSDFNRPKICEYSIWCKKVRIGPRVAYEILFRV